ncbi:hypothetical protein C0989_001706 [Termitomyces sp. Mn162]|nr:hypothetical protein C0989_001706 [Termitomyces sp. Mn162]
MAAFSIAEFGKLVALALETDDPDQFSETFLQFDPELAPLKRTHVGVRPLPQMPPAISGWTDSTPSAPRRLLNKIKHKASALVMRATEPKASDRAIFAPPPASSRCGLFAPYLPLAAQLERTRKSRGIFSRPASLVTAPPPSPTRSSISASSSPVTPTTDIFAPRPSTSPCAPANTSRWSLDTDESTTSYHRHPFASIHDHTDPFAKGRVQVVRNSADYPSYTYAFSTKRRSHGQQHTSKPDWTLDLSPKIPTRSRSFLSHSPCSSLSSSSDDHSRSHPPSAWHPSTPSPPRTRRRKAPTTPRSPESTASKSTITASGDRDRDRERARALAVLNGEVHPRRLVGFEPGPRKAETDVPPPSVRSTQLEDSESAYYSARSSLADLNVGWGKDARVRVDSEVRGKEC